MDFTSLIPQFGNVFFFVVAFIAALSVIVAIHEYGHYIVGRWCGIKADVFSLGFGPVLFSRIDRHGTRWQVAALPFGGYVKFMGDANAASGTSDGTVEELPPEEKRKTMLGAPLWARTATVAAGPVFNFILSILVFAGVFMSQGKVTEPLTVAELRPLPVEGVTLAPGDELLRIEGIAMPEWDSEDEDVYKDFVDQLPRDGQLSYEVRRDGAAVTVTGPHPSVPVVMQLAPRSAAFETGLKQGDVIVSVEGNDIVVFDQLVEVVESSNGRSLALQVWRDGEVLDFTLTPKRVDEPLDEGGFETNWRIGIVGGGLPFELETGARGAGEALSDAVARTWSVIDGSLSGLYHMVTGAISSCNMSGPIGIAEVSGAMASQGADSFIIFIAVLSTAVGLLNLFPIPVLDGGHLVFYAYEAAAGRPPSEKALRIMMTIGLTLVLGLMVFAIFNDIVCP